MSTKKNKAAKKVNKKTTKEAKTTHVFTRKVELRFNVTETEERNRLYRQLESWVDICRSGYNHLLAHLFVLLMEQDFIYMSEYGKNKIFEDNLYLSTLPKEERRALVDAANKEIYKVVSEESGKFFPGSVQNAFYQLLSKRYKGQIPTAILSAMANTQFATFNKDKIDYIKGNKSLRTYAKNVPIPFPAANIRDVRRSTYEGKETKNFAFSLFSTPFRTHLGLDLSNNQYLLEQCFSSYFLPSWVKDAEAAISDWLLSSKYMRDFEYQNKTWQIAKREGQDFYSITVKDEAGAEITFKMKEQKYTDKVVVGDQEEKIKKTRYIIADNIRLCDSSIQVMKKQEDGSNGKTKTITRFFLLAVMEADVKEVVLHDDKVARVYLSPEVPLKVEVGNKSMSIGTKDDFFYRRIGIQGALRKTQRDLRFEGGSVGRRRKLKPLERYEKAERHVVLNKIHNYTRKLIDFCLENQCKTLVLMNVNRTKEDAKENPYILRNFSVGSFESIIRYKAQALKIIVQTDEANVVA